MGQQQLLLLVLGIVIVGIAVVAGIQAFSEGKTKAQSDAAVSDATRIISDLQAWYLKPTAFGGGGEDSTEWANVQFSAVGLNPAADDGSDATLYETVNGCFNLAGVSGKATVTIYTRSANTCAASALATAEVKNASVSTGITWTYN